MLTCRKRRVCSSAEEESGGELDDNVLLPDVLDKKESRVHQNDEKDYIALGSDDRCLRFDNNDDDSSEDALEGMKTPPKRTFLLGSSVQQLDVASSSSSHAALDVAEVDQSIFLSICLSIYLSIYLHLSIYLPIKLNRSKP